MTTFYTSDPHLGHDRIIGLCKRPFRSVDEMNKAIVERWNATVDHTDTVYVLGDVALGKIGDSLALVRGLSGYKILIAGNHDRCFLGLADGKRKPQLVSWTRRYQAAGFAEVHGGVPLYEHDLEGYGPVTLSHFPYVGDSHGADRWTAYRPVHTTGNVLLHGHVHEAWDHQTEPGLQINVGVDVNDFTPVPAEVLVTRIKELQ